MDNHEIKNLTADDQQALFLKFLASKIRTAKRSPLSFSQERIWAITHLNPENISFNIFNTFYIFGELDEAVLEKSLNEIVRRHEILRSVFLTENERPVQATLPMFPFRLKTMDISAFSSDKSALEQTINREKNQSFNLSQDLPFRTVLLRLAQCKYILILVMHQIIVDGESWPIVIRELGSIYQALKKGTKPSLPNLVMQYTDYAGWQRERLKGDAYILLSNYWRDRFQESIAPLQLPADRLHTTNLDIKAHTCKFKIEPAIHTQLKKLSQKEKVSLFVTLLTTFNCLLYMYTQQEQFLIFTSVSSKNRPELAVLIGLFSNLVPLQVKIMRNWNLTQVLESVGKEVNNAVAHQDLPFDKITEFLKLKLPERKASFNSLFQVMFTFRQMDAFEYNLGDIRIEPIEIELEKELNFQMRLGMIERADHIECTLTYNATVFEESTIQQIVDHYLVLLETYLKTPEIPISGLPVFQSITRHSGLLAGKRAKEPELTIEYVAPSNEIEEKLVEIWQEVLGLERIGVNDNFFAMGGDSMKGLRVVSLYNKYNLKIIVEDLFRYPTIRKLSEYIKANGGEAGKPFIDDDVKALEIPEGVILEKEKFNISPLHYSGLTCSQDLIASTAVWLKRNFELMFAKSWGFAFGPKSTEGGEFIPIGRRVSPNVGNKLEDLLIYHGIRILIHAQKSYRELLETIVKELEAGYPVAVACDTYWIPWDIGFQRAGRGTTHFFLITGYDSQNRYVYCVDPFYLKLWEPMPIDYLIKGQKGQYFTFLILHDENPDIDWKAIIVSAVSQLKGGAELENAFIAMRRFAEEMKRTFDAKLEIGGQASFLRSGILENTLSITLGRKQFGRLLEYIARAFDVGELMPYAKELIQAGYRWETIRDLIQKMNNASDSAPLRMKLYEMIMEAAEDEERISEEIFKLCEREKFTSLDQSIDMKGVKNTGNSEFVFLDLAARFNNKGCGSTVYETCTADIS